MMSWCFSALNTSFFTLYYWKQLLPSTSSTSLAHCMNPEFPLSPRYTFVSPYPLPEQSPCNLICVCSVPSIHHNAACSKFGLTRSCHTNLPVFTCPSHTLYTFPVHSSAFSSVCINCFYISNFLSINSPTILPPLDLPTTTVILSLFSALISTWPPVRVFSHST